MFVAPSCPTPQLQVTNLCDHPEEDSWVGRWSWWRRCQGLACPHLTGSSSQHRRDQLGQWRFPLHSKSLRHSLCTASAVDKHITPVQSTEVQSPLKCNNALFLNHSVKVQLALVKCHIFGRNSEKLKFKMCACVRKRHPERERERERTQTRKLYFTRIVV